MYYCSIPVKNYIARRYLAIIRIFNFRYIQIFSNPDANSLIVFTLMYKIANAWRSRPALDSRH